jgi:glycerol-3-phosphate dehydrogenase (NAD(P)+)
MLRISILGAGNWGTTLALMLVRRGHDVILWEYDAAQADLVQRTRTNERFLPGYALPESILVTGDLSAALHSPEVLLLSVPAQTVRRVLQQIRSLPPSVIVVCVIKGIEQKSLLRVSEICTQELADFDPSSYAVISGPTIAPEVAAGLPSSAVVASKSLSTAERVQTEFSSREMRLYTTEDVIGVELAGSLKNVIAVAAGMCDGMNLGYNTKGTLLTRGLAEMIRLGTAMGGDRKTFSGLSGIGDLITTCMSPQSRNRRIGESIGRGESVAQALQNLVMVAEGVWTAHAALELANRYDITMPITEAVCAVLDDHATPHQVLQQLMQRTLKPEN